MNMYIIDIFLLQNFIHDYFLIYFSFYYMNQYHLVFSNILNTISYVIIIHFIQKYSLKFHYNNQKLVNQIKL